MKLIAHKYSGRKDIIKKTLDGGWSLDYNYVKETNLMNPIISISVSDDMAFSFFDYNYVVLNPNSAYKDFGSRERYYYVDPTQTVSVSKGLWHVGLILDDLMTYQSEILADTANIERSSSSYNLYLNDTFYNAYAYPRIGCKEFPSGFENNYSYLLTVCNTLDVITPQKIKKVLEVV